MGFIAFSSVVLAPSQPGFADFETFCFGLYPSGPGSTAWMPDPIASHLIRPMRSHVVIVFPFAEAMVGAKEEEEKKKANTVLP